MDMTQQDRRTLAAIEDGLPLTARPYRVLAQRTGSTEKATMGRLRRLIDAGVVRRLGLIVNHRELGYVANAMVVWDVPDDEVDRIGAALGRWPSVSLSYRRPRRLPGWPYNLFCMLHGRDRADVLSEVERLAAALSLAGVPRAVLFSRRRFKQRGARYSETPSTSSAP